MAGGLRARREVVVAAASVVGELMEFAEVTSSTVVVGADEGASSVIMVEAASRRDEVVVESSETVVTTGIAATSVKVAESEAGKGEADAEGATEEALDRAARTAEEAEGEDAGVVVAVGRAAVPPSEMRVLGLSASLRRVAVS